MEPLVKVLKLVDQDKKPTLSVIYEAMDSAKLAIKTSIKQWKKYWEVIDRRWEGQLHRDLYAVKLFVDGQGEFGSALTKKVINQSLPDEWWNNYGDEGPHLQNIVVKILSQTCSSSGCERNWSTWRGGGTSGASRGVGGTGEGTGGYGSTRGWYVSQVDPDMSWAQGNENCYAT
ncbi:hypothetical protein CK203_046489 [Vitis vinifera]|uniref:HAT C-terminal dimerisation domain-containing protein n=1 Tax=Vitis vinifera TaxID=29760 RepID=A0A438ILI7_VITVI|nr:hypothetical protein CK203_046489 [Vitis vinifera]